jgi:hypothetical protein
MNVRGVSELFGVVRLGRVGRLDRYRLVLGYVGGSGNQCLRFVVRPSLMVLASLTAYRPRDHERTGRGTNPNRATTSIQRTVCISPNVTHLPSSSIQSALGGSNDAFKPSSSCLSSAPSSTRPGEPVLGDLEGPASFSINASYRATFSSVNCL